MKRETFYYRGEKYNVVAEIGESSEYHTVEGKKEGGRKKVTVKIDKYNGQCVRVD